MAAIPGINRIYTPSKDEITPRNLRCQRIAITGIFLGVVAAAFSSVLIGVGFTTLSLIALRKIQSVDIRIEDETPLQKAAANGQLIWLKFLLFFGANPNKVGNGEKTPFRRACEEGHLEAAKFLIESGADLTLYEWPNQMTALQFAASKGNVPVIHLILEKDPTLIEQNTMDGRSLLFLATQAGQTESVRAILEKSADINNFNQKKTAFQEALRIGNTAILQMLLDPTLINQKNQDEYTPLYLACKTGRPEIVRTLLEKGANMEALNGPDEYTALHLASLHGHTAVVRTLLERPLNALTRLDKTTKQGKTALHLACLQGHRETAQLLISKGANLYTAVCNAAYQGDTKALQTVLEIFPKVINLLEQEVKDGITPLYLACLQGHRNTAQLLLGNGADMGTALNAAASRGNIALIQQILVFAPYKKRALDQTTNGLTPLGCACSMGHVETAQFLLNQGANINVCNGPNESTALHLAALNGHASVIQLILQKTPNKTKVLEQKTKDELTPLLLACQQGHIAAVRTLLSHGANTTEVIPKASSLRDKAIIKMILEADQFAALQCAVRQRDVTVIRLILENSSDKKRLLEQKSDGLTLLGWACSSGFLEAAQHFIEHGADITALNGPHEYTALHLASMNGHASVVQMLLQKTADKKGCLEQTARDMSNPLSLAIQHNHPAVVRMLLSHGAFWWEIFHLAIWQDNTAVIGLILENIPDKKTCLEHTTKHGFIHLLEGVDYTPLSLAIKYNRPAAVGMLLAQGANACGALNNAIAERNSGLVRMILENAPDKKSLLDQKTVTRSTPLHFACQSGQLEAAQLLLDHGADLNAVQEPAGWTPFHLAVFHKHLPVVRMLLEKVPNKKTLIEQKTVDGATPLFWACQKGYQDIVQLLVEHGANVNAPNEQALHQACKFGHVAVVSYLLDAGAEVCHFREEATPYSIAALCQQNEVLDLFFEHQKKTLTQAVKLIRQGKPSDQTLIYILNCILRESLLRSAVTGSSFEVHYLDRNTKLFSGTLNLFHKSKIFDVHLKLWHGAYSKTQDCSQLQEMRARVLLIHDRLFRIRPIYSFFKKEFAEPCLAENDKLRAEYSRLAEACGSKIASLEVKDPELEFDEEDSSTLLSQVGLLVGCIVGGVLLSPEAAFISIMGVPMKKIGEKRLTEGADLRRIGITYTLRYLSERLANERDQVMPAIWAELTRIEEVIPKNAPNREQLLEWSSRLKKAQFSASELKEFHRDYVIAVLRAYLNR